MKTERTKRRKKNDSVLVKLSSQDTELLPKAEPSYEYGPTSCATLLRRYKRFLADVQVILPGMENNESSIQTVVHCPNTGPMVGLLDRLPSPAVLSVSANAARKYAHTLEMVQPEPGGAWVGIHSALANTLVHRLLASGALNTLGPIQSIEREVKYGVAGCGKDVAAAQGDKIALFPDTVSIRAQRHVRELMHVVEQGAEAACVYVIQRGDCSHFAPCFEKDPVYAALVSEAQSKGVSMLALRCALEPPQGERAACIRYLGPAHLCLDYKKPSE